MITAAHRLFQVGKFSPLSLAPSFWLSDTGSNVGQWDDMSGNGKHVTQVVGILQPSIVTGAINGRQVRRFNGASSRMSNTSAFLIPASGSHSMFIVARVVPNGITNFNGIQALIDTNHNVTEGTVVQTRPDLGANRMSFATVTNAMFTPSSPQIFSCVLNQGSSSLLAVNGQAYTGGAFTHINKQGIYVGHWAQITAPARFFAQDIAEIIVLPYAATTEQRQAVERFLANKYAITI